MKRLTFLIIFLLTNITYSKEIFKVIDTNYVLENYTKSQIYNKKLKEKYEKLSYKYHVDINDLEHKKIKDSSLKKELLKLKEEEREHLDEINGDLIIAIFINFPEETIFPTEVILSGRTKDISNVILNFLNDMYVSKINIEKRVRLNDYIIN